ncbi:calcium/sodium antiporter [Lachnospiraceae bacterium 50-23]|nr:calcium/sodium antiporter [Dorea sp.]GFI37326.1 inner membrane protein YrbG [Lachnospiraceae bacterium]
MELAITVFLFIAGVIFVVKGGDYFVDAASWIAEVSGIPKLIIGATIVSVATTLPEMLVSVMAATQGKVDMSIGNAIGSVTANIGLIMAIALISMPGIIRRGDYLLKSVLMLAASAITVACGFLGEVNLMFSFVLLAIFLMFLWENISAAKQTLTLKASEQKDSALTDKNTVIINTIKFFVGAVGIVWGADLLVDNGSELARLVGVSERIIGVTLVAVGTSLPELITTVTAIAKKQSALSVGNILGANIMDLTLIMPLSALISGQSLPISATSARIDLPACLIVGLIAIVPAMTRSKFSRWQGFCLLTVYTAYVICTCVI